MNKFLNKHSRKIFIVLAGFVIGMISHYSASHVLGGKTTQGIRHLCEKDSFELVYKGAFSKGQVTDEMISPYSTDIFYRKPLNGYINTPHSAVRIATALITQEYGNPCTIGITNYELYICDSLWIVKGKAKINNTDATLVVEINKNNGQIWRIDKYD